MPDEDRNLKEGSTERSVERDVGSNPTPRTNTAPPNSGAVTNYAAALDSDRCHCPVVAEKGKKSGALWLRDA